MADLSKISERRLLTCHPDLINVMRTVIRDYDFSVLCGHRTESEQHALYVKGRTEPGAIVTYTDWPDSKHNGEPSLAVDIVPYPIDWNNIQRFHELAGRVLEVAALFDLNVTWGGHWERFKDYPHFQLNTGGTA